MSYALTASYSWRLEYPVWLADPPMLEGVAASLDSDAVPPRVN